MPTLSERLIQAVTETESYRDLFYLFVNGDDQTEVSTDNGPVKTIAKAIHDLEAYYVNNNLLSQTIGARDQAYVYMNEAEGFRDEAEGFRDDASGIVADTMKKSANLSDVQSLTAALTNLGLAKNQAAADSIVTHEGTIITANAGQLTEVDSNGKVKSSGKSFGATVEDALSLSGDKSITALDAFLRLGTPVRTWLPNYMTTSASGTGVATANRNYVTLATDAVGMAGCRPQDADTIGGWVAGSNDGLVARRKPFLFGAICSRLATTAGAVFRMIVGQNAPYGVLDATSQFGLLIKDGGDCYGVYYNTGTASEVLVDLDYTINNSTHEIVIIGCHKQSSQGYMHYFVDGVHIGSMTGVSGSSGSTTWYTPISITGVDNVSTQTNYVYATRWYQSPIEFDINNPS